MKTSPHNHLCGPETDRLVTECRTMTGPITYPEASTRRGEAQPAEAVGRLRRAGRVVDDDGREFAVEVVGELSVGHGRAPGSCGGESAGIEQSVELLDSWLVMGRIWRIEVSVEVSV